MLDQLCFYASKNAAEKHKISAEVKDGDHKCMDVEYLAEVNYYSALYFHFSCLLGDRVREI